MGKPATLDFAQYFIAHHPQAAARAVEQLPAKTAGLFIDQVDDDSTYRILASLLPYHAAKSIESISDDKAAKYLERLEPRVAARIIRQTDDRQRSHLLALMPRPKALLIALILNYPQSLIGAWMNPEILPAPINVTVAEMREKIARNHYPYATLFAVDEHNQVCGSVSLIELLNYKANSKMISNIIHSDVRPLFASMTLSRALKNEIWAGRDTLPVIDRDQNFIGVLSYTELRQAVDQPADNREITHGERSLLGITESFCLGLAELISTTLEAPRNTTQSTETTEEGQPK